MVRYEERNTRYRANPDHQAAEPGEDTSTPIPTPTLQEGVSPPRTQPGGPPKETPPRPRKRKRSAEPDSERDSDTDGAGPHVETKQTPFPTIEAYDDGSTGFTKLNPFTERVVLPPWLADDPKNPRMPPTQTDSVALNLTGDNPQPRGSLRSECVGWVGWWLTC